MTEEDKERARQAIVQARKELSESKRGCVIMFRNEFDEINLSAFATKYFKRTSSWLQKKLSGCSFSSKEKPFTPEEYVKLSESLRKMADRLNYYADLIDKAE